MPALDKIVSLINASHQAIEFNSRRFQTAQWNGIADDVKTVTEQGETSRPAIVDDFGEGMDVSVNDTYPMVVYHKVDSLTYDTPNEDDYGSKGTYVQETAKMRMIFWIDKSKVQVRQEDIIAASHIAFPCEFLPTQVNPFNLLEVIIDLDGTDMDTYSVFAKEFQGVQYNLPLSQSMCSISYSIISVYAKCFTLC